MNRRNLYVVLGILLALWVFHRPLLAVLVDWWWFDALGYADIFTISLSAKLGLWLTGFLVTAGVILANISLATREAPINYRRMAMLVAERGISPQQMRTIVRLMVGVWVIFPAFLFASGSASMWLEVLTFVNGGDFGQVDPVFGLDTGFYVFKLPLLEYLQDAITGLLLVTLLPLAGFYAVRDLLINHDTHVGLSIRARRHLLFLGVLIFLGFAGGWHLERFSLLTEQTIGGVVWGVGYTDENATLPAMNAMVGFCLVSAAALAVCLVKYDWRVPSGAVALYFMGALGANGLVPSMVQDYVVKPSELQKESDYLVRNIAGTRLAYDLGDVEVRPFEAGEGLTKEVIAANPLTIDNIRIWDDRPLLTTYAQIQEIRLYYEFMDVDIDRYTINGSPRQVMLAARELKYSNVPANAQSWVNEHFQYTHGYGVTVSPVNVVTTEGMPDLMVKDIPPVSVVPELDVTRPEIYYGEMTDRYVFVGTEAQEFDYPSGDENVYANYDGKGGVPVGDMWRRLVFASWFGSFDIVLSTYLTDESRVLFRRRVMERVGTVAPFLTLDQDPYLVIAEGRLKWMVDAYTTTDRAPYSEPTQVSRFHSFNYIRNSVKVVVDAYDGSIDFYISDPDDPLIRAYAQIFEGSFKPLSEMPASLQAHVRYPGDLFGHQIEKYRAYHMKDPTVFYNKEDMWDRPTETYQGSPTQMEPYYLIMRLPEEEEGEFILLMPFVPTKKDNMISWLAARSDGDAYGKLVLYSFPKQKLVYGPKQIEARIDQNPEISAQLTLWDQSGSSVLRGNLLVIPIEDSIMYVEPVYLKADQGELPELKRVIVSYEDMVVMESTLDAALARVFGAPVVVVEPVEGDTGLNAPVLVRTFSELASDANAAYGEAVEAQRGGDWAAYGAALDHLETVLVRMQAEAEAALEPEDDVDPIEGGLE